LTACGTLALEGGPIAWVATHRVHHQNTDKEGDPHSPRDGGLWAHMGWVITGTAMHRSSGELLPFVTDLRKDKFHAWISRWHWVPLTVLGVPLFVIGGWSYSSLGHFPADGRQSPRHLARKFRNTHVGIAALPYRRRVYQ
jgi:fatty-acid desaturase